ncbi:MAG: TraB/GumN family protein [Ignavibacteriales bacterium]|nr:TraB/GumN family protein [Ignavibacteriales bacterium]
MKKSIIYLLTFIIIPIFFYCSNSDENKSLLWKIETENNTVYLLGSWHLFKEEMYPLDKDIETAYDNSDIIVFEADIEPSSAMKLQAEMLDKGMFKGDSTLEMALGKNLYDKLISECQKINLPQIAINKMRPGIALLTFSSSYFLHKGFKPQLGLEYYFNEKGKTDGKTFDFLETLSFQLDLFIKLGNENLDELFKSSFDEIEQNDKYIDSMLTFWKIGDVENFGRIIDKEMDKYPTLKKETLTKRNENWVVKIEEYLRTGKNYFIVVGAGHLVGEDSVIELLKTNGYILEQI